MNGLHQFLMVAVQGGVFVKILKGQALLRFVLKLLLHHKGHGDVLSLIDPVIGDKPVHFRPQHKSLANGSADQVKIGVFILRPSRVFLCQVIIQRAQVDVHIDVSLIVGPVGVQVGGKLGHPRQLPQPPPIPPVPPFFLPFFQIFSLQFQESVWSDSLY